MKCNICPRKCGVDRDKAQGVCKSSNEIKVARIMVHNWEEPCISGTRGSGAIFFSGCNLRCVYCQNREISHTGDGFSLSVKGLADKMLELQARGVHNINLVTPTHFAPQIREAIDLIRGELKIPVVYNTSGYESAEEIAKMAGYVDVFLTDMKYFSTELSKRYSGAPDYFERAFSALGAMLEIAPMCVFDENGIMQGGVILRHLVLPGARHDSKKILEHVSIKYGTDKLKLSLMCQYTPEFCDDNFKEIKRKVTTFEYQSVLDYATELGFDGYMQDISSANTIYTPNFKEGQI